MFIFNPVEVLPRFIFKGDESGLVMMFVMGIGTERTKSPAENTRGIEE